MVIKRRGGERLTVLVMTCITWVLGPVFQVLTTWDGSGRVVVVILAGRHDGGLDQCRGCI